MGKAILRAVYGVFYVDGEARRILQKINPN